MPTHAEISSQLLHDAAKFFRTLGQDNKNIAEDMQKNAGAFEQIADMMKLNPAQAVQDKTCADIGGQMLLDAADFFRNIANDNEDLADQMNENANIYEYMAGLLQANPLGILE